MTETELLYVKTIAETGNMTKAAAALFVSQPSLSQALQRIEKKLGAQLFQRGSAGLTLTYPGRLYYESALEILKTYSAMIQEIEEFCGGTTGELRLGIASQFGRYALAHVLPKFRQQFQQVNIRLSEAASHVLIERLICGDCELAILNCSQGDFRPQCDYDILVTSPFLIVASKNSRLRELAREEPGYRYPVVDPHFLGDEPLIMLNPGHRVRSAVDVILNQAELTSPNALFYVDNLETAFTLAANDLGITFSPTQFSACIANEKLAFYSIPARYSISWSTCITTVKGGYISPPSRAFSHLIKQMIRDGELMI